MPCAGQAPTRSCITWPVHALPALQQALTCVPRAHVDAQPPKLHGREQALEVAPGGYPREHCDGQLSDYDPKPRARWNHNPSPYLRAARAHVDAQPPEPGGGQRALEVALAAAWWQAAEVEDVVAVRCGVAAPKRRVRQVARHQVHAPLVRLPPKFPAGHWVLCKHSL